MADERGSDVVSRRILAALAIVCIASSFWLVHPWYEASVETNDASMYILSAQALLRGEGYAYLGEPMIIRPPGMSVLLAPVLAWRGLDFAALNAVANVFGIAATLLFHVWLRGRVGPWVSGAAALLLWFNPGWRHYSNEVMSDVPGAALLVGAFLVERWAAARPGWRRDALLGAFIGLSTYVRTVAVLIVPAILAARALEALSLHGRSTRWIELLRTRALALTAACALVMLPWSVRNSVEAPPPPATQNFIYSYGTGMFHANPRDPSSPPRSIAKVAERVPARAVAILEVLGSRFEGRAAPIPAIVFGLWILAAFAFVAWRRRCSAEIFALLVAALLLVYFGFRSRLVLPLFVVALATFAEAHVILLSRAFAPARARAIVAAALLAIGTIDFQPRKDWDEIERAHADALEQAAAWRAVLGDRTRLASNIGWHASVYVGRPVWSFYFAAKRAGTEDDSRPDLDAVDRVLQSEDIEAVILSSDPADRAWIPWLERRYGRPEVAGRGLVFKTR